MKYNFIKKCAGLVLMFALIVTLGLQHLMISEAVTPSKENYTVFVNGSAMFICNDKEIGSKVGTEYFLTYTVQEVSYIGTQNGLVGTEDKTLGYPYVDKGLIRYANPEQANLMVEGATYFIKMKCATGGFEYNVTRIKDGKQEDLYFPITVSENKDGVENTLDGLKYFGLWFDGGSTRAKLTNVRCYDAKGNDLGVYINKSNGQLVQGQMYKDKEIDHWYDVIINNQANIGISHFEIPKTSKVYLEYKVESASYKFTQEGMAITDNTEANYPHSNGALWYNQYSEPSSDIYLLDVGAEYILRMERKDNGLTVLVQKTKNGVVETRVIDRFFMNSSGVVGEEAKYFSLWFGESVTGSFKLTNLKYYDEEKTNLGVTCNKTATIIHHGALEDYSYCTGTYYCAEKDVFIKLDEERNIHYIEKDDVSRKGTYSISEGVMSVRNSKGKETYDYMYSKIVDQEGNTYKRLYNYCLNFVSGTDEQIEKQYFNNENGYYATIPTQPKLKGYEFEGWCLRDGTEYQFESVVTESATLYAKYSGDGGVTYLANEEIPEVQTSSKFIYSIVGGGMLLVIGVVSFVLLTRKGRKDESISNN